MFFFGVFGAQGKEKEIRDVSNITCKACGRLSAYKLIKAYSYFHIFFIPVFTWGLKYYLVARCCNSAFEIPASLGKALENGQNGPIKDEDLTPLYNEAYYKGEKQCPNCRRIIDRDFQYCPHCGSRV